MSENDCQNPEEHCELHMCQLRCTEMNPEIDKLCNDPKFVCTNCGVKVHDKKYLCCPKPL